MSKYIIRTNKDKKDGYLHHFYDDKGNIVEPGSVLENGQRVKDVLYYYDLSIEPFMRTNKLSSLKLEMEVLKE